MDNELLRILNEINSTGSPAALDTVASKLEVAKKLRDSKRGNTYTSGSGRATVPSYGRAVSDLVGGRRADREVGELEQLQAQMQAQNAEKARGGLDRSIQQVSGVNNVIEGFDGIPAQARADVDPGRRQEFDALQAAVAGQDPQMAQQAVGKYALQKSLYQQQQAAKPTTSGGRTTLIQLADDYQRANPTATRAEAFEWANSQLETFTVTDVGNVPAKVGNRASGATPLSTLENEVSGAAAVNEGEAFGSTIGKGNAEWALMAPQIKSQVESTINELDAFSKKAIGIRDNPALWRATGFLSIFPNLPGWEAKNLETAVESLKAATGLNALTALKQSGVTLGQVTQAEHELLQSRIASLSLSQDAPSFRRAVNDILDSARRMSEAAKREFGAMYGENARLTRPTTLPGGRPNPASPPAPVPPPASAPVMSLDEYLSRQ